MTNTPGITPTLSICIPTHNRAEHLAYTLDSITRQGAFLHSNAVEVVLADNASTDNTMAVCRKYAAQFPQKIRCHHHEVEISSAANFAFALSMGNGNLLKLNNDTLYYHENTLAWLVDFIKRHEEQGYPLFFLNGNTRDKREATPCSSLGEFVGHVSFYATWIGAFSIWKQQRDQYLPIFRQNPGHFAQSEIFYAAAEKSPVLVCNRRFGNGQRNVKKDISREYLLKTYAEEYLSLLRAHRDTGGLPYAVFTTEKRKLLIRYLLPWYLHCGGIPTLPELSHEKTLLHDYDGDWFFYASPLLFAGHMLKKWGRKTVIRAIKCLSSLSKKGKFSRAVVA